MKRDIEFEKKNASFFDKLKERLISSSANSIVVPEVAINGTNDLKCWCTFEACNMDELASHKQTHHAALSVSMGVVRCQKCRKSFKNTCELQTHTAVCPNETTNELSNESTGGATSYRGEYSFPSYKEWDKGNTVK